jgi:uncharacterized protein (DUF1015 family)
MAEIVPFIGTRYDTKVVGKLDDVLCPPYDVISPSMQDSLYKRHKHNFVRLTLGKTLPTDDEYNNRYERSARYFREWKREGILADDEELSFYICEQEFKIPSGKKYKRRGLFAAVKLESGGDTEIRPHERTFPGPKEDRLKLLRAMQCNLSAVFVLASDADRTIASLLDEKAKRTPVEKFVDANGIKTRLWICQNPGDVQAFQETVREANLLIADGHHRFETALTYQAEMRTALGERHKNMPFDYTMMYLTSMEDEGLVILPTHRALMSDLAADVDLNEILDDLGGYFKMDEIDIDLEQPTQSAHRLLEAIASDKVNEVRMAMVLRNQPARILTFKPNMAVSDVIGLEDVPGSVRQLDVSILHNFIINQIWIGNPEIEIDERDIAYSRDAAEVLELVRQRHACAAFVLNAPRIDQVRTIAEQGHRMPHKSTFFYPKIPSGVVMRDISRPL